MKIFGLNITSDKATPVVNSERRKSTKQYYTETQKYLTRADLLTLKLAIDESNILNSYNRTELNRIYRKVLTDSEIQTQWNTRVLKTIDKEFHFESIDEDDDYGNNVANKIFSSPWFMEWVKRALEHNLWGFSLIEFGPWDETINSFIPYIDTSGFYHTPIECVDRDFVRVEKALLVPSDHDPLDNGIPYLSGPLSKRLMFVGSPKKEDSILYNIASLVLMKENAVQNWSEWAEVFAMDMRVGKTEAEGEAREKFVNAMKAMGSNGYAVVDMEDVIENIGVNRQDAYQVYQAFLGYVDAKISNIIFGQNVVSNNNGRVVGRVGENISNLYGDADAKWVQWQVNTRLIPYLISLGAPLDGVTFKYDMTEKVRLFDRAEIDKKIAEMGYKLTEDYLERVYGVDIDEYTGVPFSGNQPTPDTNE